MKALRIIFWILLICIFVGIVYFSITRNSEEPTDKVDSLNSKIDSVLIIKDSIQEKIDTVFIKIEENKKQYEKDFNHIITNNTNEDYKFFLDYINTNRSRLDSIQTDLYNLKYE